MILSLDLALAGKVPFQVDHSANNLIIHTPDVFREHQLVVELVALYHIVIIKTNGGYNRADLISWDGLEP